MNLMILALIVGTLRVVSASLSGNDFTPCTNCSDCGLNATVITFPPNFSAILNYSFANNDCNNCNLVSVYIPTTIRSIGVAAFKFCSRLTNINLPSSIRTIDNGAFYGCSNLSIIVIPTSLVSISDGLFFDTAITSIIIPTSITSIGEYSFSKCAHLHTVLIPTSVIRIGQYAFQLSNDITGFVSLPTSIISIGIQAFQNCTKATFVIPFPLSDTIYPAYLDCDAITVLDIPSTVTSIPAFAFEACTRLQSVFIPSQVTFIGDSAFLNDLSITCLSWNATLGAVVGSNAFSGTNIQGPCPPVPTFVPSSSPFVLSSSSSPTVLLEGPRLVVKVMDYFFYLKAVSVIDPTTCQATSIVDSYVLNLILQIENVGHANFVISNSVDLTEDTCTKSLVFKSFFKFQLANITKTRSEQCVEDSIEPVNFTCKAGRQGLSPGNLFLSQQWIDVSSAKLKEGQTYPLDVSILPHNPHLVYSIIGFNVTYSTVRRKRNLRSNKVL